MRVFLISLVFALSAQAATLPSNGCRPEALMPRQIEQPLLALIQKIVNTTNMNIHANYQIRIRISSVDDPGLVSEYLKVRFQGVEMEFTEPRAEGADNLVDVTINGYGSAIATSLIGLTTGRDSVSFSGLQISWLAPESALDILRIPILDLPLTDQAKYQIQSDNIFFIGDLIHRTEEQLLSGNNGIGRVTVSAAKTALEAYGLTLGMWVESWPPTDLDQIDLVLAKSGSGPMIEVDDLIRRTPGKNSTLFLPGHRGISAARGHVLLNLNSRTFPTLNVSNRPTLMNYKTFLETTPGRIRENMNPFSQAEKPSLDTVRKWKQSSLHDLRKVPIYMLSGNMGAEMIRKMVNGEKPVLLIPNTGYTVPESAIIVLPTRTRRL